MSGSGFGHRPGFFSTSRVFFPGRCSVLFSQYYTIEEQSARLLDLLIITYYQIHIRATLVLIFDSQHSVPVGTPPDWR